MSQGADSRRLNPSFFAAIGIPRPSSVVSSRYFPMQNLLKMRSKTSSV